MNPKKLMEQKDKLQLYGYTDVEAFEKFKQSVVDDVKDAFRQIGDEMSLEEKEMQENIHVHQIQETLQNLQPFFKDLMEMPQKTVPPSGVHPQKDTYTKEALKKLQVAQKKVVLFEKVLQNRCRRLHMLEVALKHMIKNNGAKKYSDEFKSLLEELERLKHEQNWELRTMKYLSDMSNGELGNQELINKKML